ncbi:MAG: amidohydrolase [Chloroflexi bacterium]|nr:amidohydrolase [Chloroflexota bacterium]
MLDGGRVVDVHHHFLPKPVFDRLKEEAGGAKRLVNDKISLTLSEDLHNTQNHLATMAEGGVDAAILTYSGVSVLGSAVCRELNDGFAELQRAQRGKLYGAAHLALTEPEAAPAELERAIRELGLVAVALPTSDGDITLDDPSLRPLWQAIDRLQAPVILHPALLPRGASTDYYMERSCARPFDTTLAAVRLIHAVLPPFPNLKVVLPHAGGTAVFLRGRIQMFYEPAGWEHPTKGGAKTQREQRELGFDRQFEALWNKFYFDTAGTGGWAPAVQFAADLVGSERMLFGSDYPLESHSGATVGELVEMIGALKLTSDHKRGIAGGNAGQLFRLEGFDA